MDRKELYETCLDSNSEKFDSKAFLALSMGYDYGLLPDFGCESAIIEAKKDFDSYGSGDLEKYSIFFKYAFCKVRCPDKFMGVRRPVSGKGL